mgnify:CR=1 FL=1
MTSPDGAPFLILANAGAGTAEESLQRALAQFALRKAHVDLRFPEDADAAGAMIREAAGRVRAVVLAGGDGTISSALPALLETGQTLGVLPLGTANDFARSLQIPLDPVQATDVVVDAPPVDIDVGLINERPFINVASLGVAVEVARRQAAAEGRKHFWGSLSYLLSTVEVLAEAEPFEATVTCDAETIEVRAYQIAIGNGIHYGGGLTIREDARIDDGWLDVYAIETESVAQLVALAPSLKRGTLHQSEQVRTWRCHSVKIETSRTMPTNVDGDIGPETPIEVSQKPGALSVIRPPVV